MRFDTVIPPGGEYVTVDGKELTENELFPVSQNGDKFYYGDYIYTYSEKNIGWHVYIKDRTKTEYGKILNSINNIPVNSLYRAFCDCVSLEIAPEIPSNVKYMRWAFDGCKSLKVAPKIPDNVINMWGTFSGCISLKTAPEIPEGVTNMAWTFANCKSLQGNVVIPASVQYLDFTFYGCDSLKTVTFENPNIDIQNTFDKNAVIRIKSLSEEAVNIAKKDYPNMKFQITSRLSEFLESDSLEKE